MTAFENLPLAPEDAIFALTSDFRADSNPNKINLGVGAYRDDDGKPWVLPVVKKATALLAADDTVEHEYLPIAGLPEFTKLSAELLFGISSAALSSGRVTSIQTISGTGANHLGAAFMSKFYKFPTNPKKVYISNPTWANHYAIWKNVGVTVEDYRYFDPSTMGLDYDGFSSDLEKMEEESIVLIHAVAHNPTGVDPSSEQWESLIDIILRKKHYIVLDCAYQGFASGDLEKDAQVLRLMDKRNVPMLVCQSFAKNAGLYSERVGAVHFVSPTPSIAAAVKSQVNILQRSEISNPPAWGARIVTMILSDEKLRNQWKDDVRTMANRISEMRVALRNGLEAKGVKGPGGGGGWAHITEQIGMFSFTGLTPTQTKLLKENYSIYCTSNGRISMAGLNTHNVDKFVEAVDEVIKKTAGETAPKL